MCLCSSLSKVSSVFIRVRVRSFTANIFNCFVAINWPYIFKYWVQWSQQVVENPSWFYYLIFFLIQNMLNIYKMLYIRKYFNFSTSFFSYTYFISFFFFFPSHSSITSFTFFSIFFPFFSFFLFFSCIDRVYGVWNIIFKWD